MEQGLFRKAGIVTHHRYAPPTGRTLKSSDVGHSSRVEVGNFSRAPRTAGKQDMEIAAEIGISNQKAARWRKRFLKKGLAGLAKDAPRPGRTPSIPQTTVDRVIKL